MHPNNSFRAYETIEAHCKNGVLYAANFHLEHVLDMGTFMTVMQPQARHLTIYLSQQFLPSLCPCTV